MMSESRPGSAGDGSDGLLSRRAALEWTFDAGRGYRSEPVEAFRASAAETIGALELQVATLRSEIDQMRQAAMQPTEQQVLRLVRTMGAAELRRLGVEAVGEAIVSAHEQAQRLSERSVAAARSNLTAALETLRSAAAELESGRAPGAVVSDAQKALLQASSTIAAAARNQPNQ